MRRSRRPSTRRRSPASPRKRPNAHGQLRRRRFRQGQAGPRRRRRRLGRHRQPGEARGHGEVRRRGGILYFPTVAAPITVSYNLSGVDKLQLDARHAGRDLLPQDHEVERRGDRRDERRRRPAGHRHRRRAPLRRFGDDEQLHQVPHDRGARRRGRSAAVTRSTGPPTPRPATATPVSRRSSATPNGAIGYVDLADADGGEACRHAPRSRTRPASFIAPTLDGAHGGGRDRARSNADLTYNPLNASGAKAYPITSPTYIIVYKTTKNSAQTVNIQGWLNYVLAAAKDWRTMPGFAPLPSQPGGQGSRPNRPDQSAKERPAWRTPPLRRTTARRGHVTHGSAGDVWADRIFRGLALVAGLTVLAILALIAYLDHHGGVARVQGRGHLVHHVQRLDPERGQVRRAGVHLRHALHRVDRDRDRGAGESSASRCSRPSWRRGGCDGRRSTSSTCSRRSRRSSTASGACSCSHRGSRPKYQYVADAIGDLPLLGRFFGPPVSGGRGFMTCRPDPRGDDHADHHRAQLAKRSRRSRRTTRTPRSAWARPAGRCCASRCSRVCVPASSARSCSASAGRWARRSPWR